MRYIVIYLFGFVFLAPVFYNTVQAASETIFAVVNEDAITQSDVEDRMKLIMISSRMPNTQEMRDQLRPQILNTLIEEQLKFQEAARLEQVVTQEEIDSGFAQIAQQNNAPPEQFKEMIMRSGININTMYRQIESQSAWGKVVQTYIRPQISISDADVQDAMQRLKENIGETEYLLAEIFLPLEDPKEASELNLLANKLSQDLREQRVPFFKVAQQFSKSAGASSGGDLGWIQQSQLEEEISEVLAKMQPNEISTPVRTRTGYHILLLREKRTLSEDTMPSEAGMMNDIGTERLERMQRRHLQDLKAGAFIEQRV